MPTTPTTPTTPTRPDHVLTPERIVAAAEETLRRFGPAKATVVDVARTLGVSHAAVYRHFPSKTALREAVTSAWLAGVRQPLEEVRAGEGRPAAPLLREWLTVLAHRKRERALRDPELFATYVTLVRDSSGAVEAHVCELLADLTGIIAAGVEQGAFLAPDPGAAARAVLNATSPFHNPAYAEDWSRPSFERDLRDVLDLVLRGLSRATGGDGTDGGRPC
ncbi:TetR family transcriptional regulator [Streptosporangium sp. NPDC023615]|uniref:TetR/AcrR family transcriptional regulator n=1 Tax=Streptosporangium sp. NPDC023615 TaxID=3154794 RepID=UPI00343C6BC5